MTSRCCCMRQWCRVQQKGLLQRNNVIRRRTTSGSSSSYDAAANRQQRFVALAIGSAAGFMGSLAGMGGGFVMIPLMTRFLQLSQHQAHGTSLCAVAATGMAGAVGYIDHVQWQVAGAVATGGMLTARLGAQLSSKMSGVMLRRSLGVLMLCMAPLVPAKAYMMKQQQDKEQKQQEEEPVVTKNAFVTESKMVNKGKLVQMAPPFSIGLASGLLAGLFGVGGGTIVVPALTIFSADFCTTHYEALATSLAAMTVPALSGVYTHYHLGNVARPSVIALPLIAGACLGSFVGGRYVALHTNENTLRWGFSGVLTVLGLRALFKS